MRMRLEGKAKAAELPHGAWLNNSTNPCGRHCQERSEDCHGKCRRWQEWEENHRKALEEYQREKEQVDIKGLKLKPKPQKEWLKYSRKGKRRTL